MAAAGARAYRIGAFAMTLGNDGYAGYIRKVDLGKVKGELVTHNLGGSNVQKKHIAKMSHDPISFEVGVGMGKALYDWIKSSFEMKHVLRDGEILVGDHDYRCVRRIVFSNATITEISLPKFDAKGKEGLYFTIKIQPETVRMMDGDNKNIQVIVGDKQKQHQSTNFRVDAGGLPTRNVMSIDALKWTQKVTEHAVGEHLESQYVPTAVEVGTYKVTVASVDYTPWYEKANQWFMQGNRSEAQEMTHEITILGPDAKQEVASIILENCGMTEFAFAALEANKDAVSSFDSTWYTERIKLDIRVFNS